MTALKSPESRTGPLIRNVDGFAAAKRSGTKIVMVTAYDAWSARLLADSPVDCLLVGDSAMMVVHGENDTLGATPEIMEMHTRAVVRGAGGKFVVADMPFLAARKGENHALDCAAGLLRAGAHAVKIEGAQGHLHVIRHLVESGIPVMGHLGLTPQWVRGFGGFKVQAKAPEEAGQLLEDAAALEQAGIFSLVLECIPHALASEVTAKLAIPTIGIGAGSNCDGQVLVLQDLLGLNPDFKPRFSRRFAEGAAVFRDGAEGFASAVRSGEFPAKTEAF
ncbi:MAG TPA: 3-methyl-2-oxobutanoate hydroxymethyltransferase [Opitutaceae bacterium]|nr:3-methyl-2-oxobutanoate hydroxymethyltransferase [Opitutaceae bacterium]